MFGKKAKQRQQQAEDRLREEALDRVLLNPNANVSTFAEKPVEVDYNMNDVNKGKSSASAQQHTGHLMLEVEEISALSRKKYMLNPENGVLIGSKNGVNNIVIVDSRIADIQCEILMYNKELYIRNVGDKGQPVLKRGRNVSPVGTGTIPLKNKDRLSLGDVELIFSQVIL